MEAATDKAAAADVIVIGGGPAGCAVALRLARQHFHVVLLERQGATPSARDRLRSGEGLIPRTRRELDQLGLTVRQAPWALSQIDEIRTVQADGTASSDLVGGLGGIVQIDRLLFEDQLRSAAAQAGVDMRLGWRARRFLRTPGEQVAGVVAQPPGSRQECSLRAPIVVDASGRNALSFRHFDIQLPAANNFAAIVMFFDRVAGLEAQVWEMHVFGTDALNIVQLSQIEPGIIRCGLGVCGPMPSGAAHHSASLFWNRIAQNSVLAGRLQGSRPVQRPYVRVGIGYRVRRVTFDGLVLVGDASGYVNPLFGDGILRALSGARQAAVTVEQALRRGDCSCASLASYERQHALHFRVDQALLKLLAALAARPNLPIWLASLHGIRHGLFAALLR